LISKHFGLPLGKSILLVPNAVEFNENELFESTVEKSDTILHVGTILPSKNQSGTLLALKTVPDFELYFIGRIKDVKYYHYLLKLGKKRGRVIFPGELAAHEVNDFYRKAKVHVLPSFGECAALVSLEALWNSCEIVVSNNKFTSTNYYKYNEISHLCDPYKIGSIKEAILDAIKYPKMETIDRRKYFEFFNYETVARNIFNAYQSTLAKPLS